MFFEQVAALSPVHTSNNVEATFDFKVETNWTCSICFNFVERTKFRSTLLPKPATIFRSNCRKNRSTYSIRQCCFDIVASVDGALEMCKAILPRTECICNGIIATSAMTAENNPLADMTELDVSPLQELIFRWTLSDKQQPAGNTMSCKFLGV